MHIKGKKNKYKNTGNNRIIIMIVIITPTLNRSCRNG